MDKEGKGCNVGCLLVIAAVVAIDAAAWYGMACLGRWLAQVWCG